MIRTIKVKGKGSVSVKPDMTRISFSISSKKMNYEDALKRSASDSNSLRQIAYELGFNEDSIKTDFFEVEVLNESYRDRNDDYKSRFAGYRVNHGMKIEFESDNELLGKFLGRISGCLAKPQFGISFFVKDTESVKNRLLEIAVEDARTKASVISKAAGVKLGVISNIEYSWGEIRFESGDYSVGGGLYDTSFMPIDIEPDDLNISDTVTVEWEIE